MAGSTEVACTAGQWTKVATNITKAAVHIVDQIAQRWLFCTQATGGAAPTLITEGIVFSGNREYFDVAAGIDVYVWPSTTNGSVRTDD